MSEALDNPDIIPDIDMPPHNIAHPRLARGVLGQNVAEATFIQAVQSGRLPHAWILYGSKGVGKASFAYHIARHFFSTSDETSITQIAAPPDSPESKLVESGAHPDLFVLKRIWNVKDGNNRFFTQIRAEEARGLHKPLQRTASQGGWRIAIIDSIDEMNEKGVASLLKLIEEPPPRVLFLIICHQLGNVIDTIRSRTRLLSFNPLAPEDCRAVVARHFPALAGDALDIAVFLGEGSVAHACRFAENEKNGGIKIYTDFINVLATMPRANIKAMHDLANLVSNRSKPENFPIFCDLITGWLHRLTRMQVGGQAPENLPASEAQLAQNWQHIPTKSLLDLWSKIQTQTKTANALNLDKKQTTLEWLKDIKKLFN